MDMNSIKDAMNFRRTFTKIYPKLQGVVDEYFQLMLDEIDSGESIYNEVERFIRACDDLLTTDDE